MESLVKWNKKRDKYDDEAFEDETEVRKPRLTDTIQGPEFIMRDSANAEAMKTLRIKW